MKWFNMQESKTGFLPITDSISLLKAQCPKTQDEREHMSKIPYVSTIRSIMYVMLCTYPIVAYVLSIMSRYQSDLGEHHWLPSRISLSTCEGLKMHSWYMKVKRN